jgi:hypothetical protein
MVEYRHGSHTVFSIHLHIVWITKYRHQVLKGEVAERVRDIQGGLPASWGRYPEGPYISGSCPCDALDTTPSDDQSVSTADEGQEFLSAAIGVPAPEEAILGEAYLGTRLFLP